MSGSPPTVLERILQSTREELARRKRLVPASALEQQASDEREDERPRRSLRAALSGPTIAVIAEFKRRSPSAGEMRAAVDLREIVMAYEQGGASGLSVLTESPNFGGSLEDLSAARGFSGLPILRKDFIVDRYQLLEARAAGADAVLLIVAALSPEDLTALHDAARSLGLEVLVEVHDSVELERALELGAQLIGINNRDLRDFSVDVERTTLLMGAMPAGMTVVSESGIATSEQLRDLQKQGVDAVLVGGALMRSPDPRQALRSLIGHDLGDAPSSPAEAVSAHAAFNHRDASL
jgi:indole-3-glycerol phosphate synthase